MARLLLLAGDPGVTAAAGRAIVAARSGTAWLSVHDLAAHVGTAGPDAPDPSAAAAVATAAAAVELVAAGSDVVVAGGPSGPSAYADTWRPVVGGVDHRVVVVGDGGDWPDAHRVPDGDAAAVAAALADQLGVPGSGWRDDEPTDGIVRLRPPRPADVPALVAACRDPEIARWTTVPSPYDDHHAAAFVARAASARRRGTAANFVVVDPADDRLLGSAGLVAVDWRFGTATVGYWVAPWARRGGVAGRALRLVGGFAFDRVGVARLELEVVPGNDASCRVAERAGYRREGVRRSAYPWGDGRTDVISYALVRDDLEEAPVG